MRADVGPGPSSRPLWWRPRRAPGSEVVTPFTGTTKAQIVIEVDNRNFNQATVWMLSGSGERRRGVVNGKIQKTFTIRWPRSDDLRLRVRVLGGRGFTTARQLVFPGDHVELRIT